MKNAGSKRENPGKNLPVDGSLVVTIDQAALMLQLGRVSVYKLLRTGKLQSLLFGRARRITRASIDRLMGSV